MKKLKKILFSSGMLSLVFFLSGCVKMNKDGTPDKSGLIYRFLVQPMGSLIHYLVQNFNWTYGWAVIVITIIVRIILMPVMINQSKKSLIQSEKMQVIKPQMDLVQQKMKEAVTQEEQMQVNMEMQTLYRENGISMTGGMGCLPMLLQMPVFSALYFTARFTEGIATSHFYGIDLGKSSLLLVAISGVAYFGQSLISMIGIPQEQRKTMMTMTIASPLMIVFMSLSAPAGVTLYWVVGGIFSCIQTYITNVIMRPRIKKQIQEDLKNNPPRQIVTPMKKKEPKPEVHHNNHKNNQQLSYKNSKGNGRNAGKQQHRKQNR